MRHNRSRAFALISVATASVVLAQPGAAPTEPPPAKTTAAKAKPVYDEAADARAQIAAALARAKHENKRVLIQWGGNWCSWCLLLHKLCETNPQIRKELQYEYEVVHVDAGRDDKNLDLGAHYKAKLEDGFPYLTILDADGSVIANQETGSLEVKDENGESVLGTGAGHDPAKVLKFLTDHQAAAQDAESVFATGLKEAKAAQKEVFVHFSAPWCVWCRRLDAWMQREDVAPLLAKEFVDIKIDVDRMTNGQALFAKLNPASQSSGIPWFAIVDGDGKPLADSTRTDGAKSENIGFPASDAEIAHFEAMLSKSATHLTREEIARLVTTLRDKAPARSDAR